MKDEFKELDELMAILGYSDERSVKKWCKRYKIPVIKIGAKKYIPSHLLTQYIDNQLVIFAKANSMNADLIIETVRVKKTYAKEIKMDVQESIKANDQKKETKTFLRKAA